MVVMQPRKRALREVPGYWRVARVACYFDTSPAKVREMIQAEELKAIRWGQQLRVTVSSIKAYVERHGLKQEDLHAILVEEIDDEEE